MTVERVNVPDPVSKYNKSSKVQKTKGKAQKDSISLSEDAKSKGEIYKATESVKMIPAVGRTCRVRPRSRKVHFPFG